MGFWTNKVVLVTGGGRGIGQSFARLVARQGASVVVADIDGAAAEETASLIGPAAVAIATDVTGESDVQRAVDLAVSRFGRLDMLHNNASILRRNGDIDDISLKDFREIIEVNTIGCFLAARAAVVAMKRTGGGVIVNMSSRGARGQPQVLAYSTSKAGVIAFTRALAEQMRPANIRVNALLPGLVDTAMTQGGSYLQLARKNNDYIFHPDELAAAVAYVAEPEDQTGAIYEYFGGSSGPEMHRLNDFAFEKLDVRFPARLQS